MPITDLSEDRLKCNFQTHLNNITNGRRGQSPDFMDRFMLLEVTHTFAESDYENIFLNPNESHRGLLSYEYRRINNLQTSRTPSEPAYSFGLSQFVFAYLGSHEPYYAGNRNPTPFGVFISRELESRDTSNASRRDLASNQISMPFEDEFMLPEDARRIIAFEIERNYNGDIWSYWGNSNNDIMNMWHRKAEMHFFEKVEPKNITAIIWPVYQLYTEEGASYSHIIDKQRKFTESFPHIRIYEYDWSPDYGEDTFLKASYQVSRYFFENGNYPDNYRIIR